jgi:2-iminobutanoate/2-iminopropanoate deaminase
MTRIQHIREVSGETFSRLPFSRAVVAGDLVFCSGEIGFIPGTTDLVEGGIEAQTRQTLANLSAVLEAAGSSLAHVVKTLVFIAAPADFAAFNGVYKTYFDPERLPSRSTIVAGFVAPGVLVEVECVAVRAGQECDPNRGAIP